MIEVHSWASTSGPKGRITRLKKCLTLESFKS
jgi:hypothetical protein